MIAGIRIFFWGEGALPSWRFRFMLRGGVQTVPLTATLEKRIRKQGNTLRMRRGE